MFYLLMFVHFLSSFLQNWSTYFSVFLQEPDVWLIKKLYRSSKTINASVPIRTGIYLLISMLIILSAVLDVVSLVFITKSEYLKFVFYKSLASVFATQVKWVLRTSAISFGQSEVEGLVGSWSSTFSGHTFFLLIFSKSSIYNIPSSAFVFAIFCFFK